MKKYFGKRVYEGIAIGQIIRLDEIISLENTDYKGFEIEMQRFNEARNKVINDYKSIYEKEESNNSSIILSFISIAEDLDLIESVENLIKNKNKSAEESVYESCQNLKEMLLNIDNEYLKERVNDIDEVCNKIIKILQQKQEFILNQESIILSKNLNVSTFLQMDKSKILGLVLEDISPNSHIAILARSLAIPCIASLTEKVTTKNNEEAILDCAKGILIIAPSHKYLDKYNLLLKESNDLKNELNKYKNIAIKTIDNKTIKVYANISSSLEIEAVLETNADGIGLFRSEYLYLNSNSFPTEEEQYKHYVKCVSLMKDKETIIRTMDIGADKIVKYFNISKENNPALGYRGVRLYKEFKDVFLVQLQALLRASYYGNLKIMIPMITNIDEVHYVIECLDEAKENLKKRNILFNDNIKLGVMIETPASALICDEIAKYVDFFSIGTNDLSQYVLAIDRENSKVLNAYNPKHKAILKLIYYVSKIAKENNIEIGICGELARNKDLQGFYILCGIDEISVSTSYILECKKNITELDIRSISLLDYIN